MKKIIQLLVVFITISFTQQVLAKKGEICFQHKGAYAASIQIFATYNLKDLDFLRVVQINRKAPFHAGQNKCFNAVKSLGDTVYYLATDEDRNAYDISFHAKMNVSGDGRGDIRCRAKNRKHRGDSYPLSDIKKHGVNFKLSGTSLHSKCKER